MNYPQIKPTLNLDFSNTKTLDPRITFRRGTPGAYYDGKTYAKAEENLLSYSEDFGEWHSVFSENVTSQDDPSGGTSATLLTEDDTSGESHGLRFDGLASFEDFTTFTFSVYLKKKERDYVDVSIHGDANQYASVRFNLSAGVVSQSTTAGQFTILEKNIESAPGDWYRAIITAETGGSNPDTKIYIGLSNDSDVVGDRGIVSYNGDGSSGLYVWGAQLEQRDNVTAYTSTMREDGTSVPITKYQPRLMFASPDQPRFDHDPLTGESKGLLIEESRTNFIEYSEDFGAWTKTGAIDVDSQGTIGLDNKSFASKITRKQTGSTGDQNIYITKDLGNANKHSISLYVKPVSDCDLVLNTGSYAARFNFSSLTVTDLKNDGLFDGGRIESLGNGWYRCSANGTGANGSVQYQIIPWIGYVGGDWSNDRDHDGDSVSGLYIWGAQLEVGSFPTSYIKTSGVEADRSADNASITGENFSSWYRQDEGSLFFEASTFDRDDGQARLTISDETDSIRFYFGFLGSNILKVDSATQGSNIVDYDIDFDDLSLGEYHKRSFGLKKDDFAVCINGELSHADTDSSGVIPAVNALHFSTRGVSHFSNSHIKKLSYYPQRLTNEQLQQLTK